MTHLAAVSKLGGMPKDDGGAGPYRDAEILGEIADALGIMDVNADLVAIVEELVDWLPEYTLDDGTDEPANVRERAEYAAGELAQLHTFAQKSMESNLALSNFSSAVRHYMTYSGKEHLTRALDALPSELAREETARIRKAALKEAADLCRRGIERGQPGWSYRADCAEEIEELADES